MLANWQRYMASWNEILENLKFAMKTLTKKARRADSSTFLRAMTYNMKVIVKSYFFMIPSLA